MHWIGTKNNPLVLYYSLTKHSFSAAQLGLPRLMRDEDAQCEYPVDADDEYVTEKGFLPTLPGEFTKLSSALALFKASRILAKVLAEIYPSTASYEISFRNIEALSDELDEWSNNLPSHLRLQFIQDKPSTLVISSRSPLLVRQDIISETQFTRSNANLHGSLWGTTTSVR
jgi:hypothetical protein